MDTNRRSKMTVQNLPFFLYRRKSSKYFYVRFKDSATGEYFAGISTKQTDEAEAAKTAWAWYSQGKIRREDREETLENVSLFAAIRKADISDSDAEKVLDLLKRRGILKSFVKAGDRCDVPLIEYLSEFWDWEKSEYVQEKLKREKSIGRTHVKASAGHIKKYWKSYFGDEKLLGEITRDDLKKFLLDLQKKPLGNSSKNQIWIAGAQAIRYAFQNEIIEKDVTAGLSGFYGGGGKREILTPEMAAALFSVEWNDKRAYLANLLAMCTGLRAGEIRALRKKDLGKNCLYIKHSWNDTEGLKSTKNGEERTVQLPFPQLSEKLLELAESNPFDSTLDAFVFYATIPEKPIEANVFRIGLHNALEKIGLPKESAKRYCFHAWRHFYASYMRDKVGDKLLQSQTGHKTLAMLEHYSEHKIVGDDEKIQQAQIGLFGDIVNNARISFDEKRLYNNVKVAYMDKSELYEHTRQNR